MAVGGRLGWDGGCHHFWPQGSAVAGRTARLAPTDPNVRTTDSPEASPSASKWEILPCACVMCVFRTSGRCGPMLWCCTGHAESHTLAAHGRDCSRPAPHTGGGGTWGVMGSGGSLLCPLPRNLACLDAFLGGLHWSSLSGPGAGEAGARGGGWAQSLYATPPLPRVLKDSGAGAM